MNKHDRRRIALVVLALFLVSIPTMPGVTALDLDNESFSGKGFDGDMELPTVVSVELSQTNGTIFVTDNGTMEPDRYHYPGK